MPEGLPWNGLLVPDHERVVAATVLAIASLVCIGVHVKYRGIATIIICVVTGLLMAFIVYGRMVVKPIV